MLPVLAALALFLANVLTPGASFVLTVSNAMAHGRRSGCWIALGLATADVAFALAAVLGLAAVVSGHPSILRAIALLGGLWFIYGGLRLLLRGKAQSLPAEADRTAGELPARLAYRLGLTAGSFNPQAIIFFSTLFVAALSAGPDLGLLALLVAGVAVISAGARCGIVVLFTSVRVQSAYLRHRRKVEACSGTAMTFFGVKLAAPVAVYLARGL